MIDIEAARNGHLFVAGGAGTSNPLQHQQGCPGCAALDRIEDALVGLREQVKELGRWMAKYNEEDARLREVLKELRWKIEEGIEYRAMKNYIDNALKKTT